LWETILNGDIWNGEVINTTKDGDQYVVNQTIAPVTDDTKKITHFVAVNTNITDQKQQQREQELLWEAIETVHTPLVLTHPNKEDQQMV
jgi:predicted acylesterase/phospholipase RssA